MKNLFKISVVVLAMMASPLSVYAQDGDTYPSNIQMPNNNQPVYPYNSTTPSMSNEDIGKLIKQTLQYNATAGDQDGQIISNGKVVNLSGDGSAEGVPQKKYRYDKELDNPLRIEEPKRLFNNIPYPY